MLKKRWHGIPIVIASVVLALVLTAGVALAAYEFTQIDVAVEVDEPLQVQFKLDYVVHDTQSPGGRTDTSGWLNAYELTGAVPAQFSAGDQMTLYLRMNNRANSNLTVSSIITDPGDVFSWSGFPQSQVIPVSNGYDFGSATVTDAVAAEWASGSISLSINGDAPAPETYGLHFEFTRE